MRSRWSLAAPARRVGAAWLRGMRQVCGPSCTACFWKGSTTRVLWTGAVPLWTARLFRQKRGRRDRAEPNGSRPAGHQAPLGHGRKRHAARPDAQRRQPARQHDVGANARCGARHPQRPRPATPPARQAARRQGLRSQAMPPGVWRPPHNTPHRQAWRSQQPEARAS